MTPLPPPAWQAEREASSLLPKACDRLNASLAHGLTAHGLNAASAGIWETFPPPQPPKKSVEVLSACSGTVANPVSLEAQRNVLLGSTVFEDLDHGLHSIEKKLHFLDLYKSVLGNVPSAFHPAPSFPLFLQQVHR